MRKVIKPIISCAVCGKRFEIYPSVAHRKRYCSVECRYRGARIKTSEALKKRARSKRPNDPERQRISLGNGTWANVSSEDYDFLMQFNWYPSGHGYAYASVPIDGDGRNRRRLNMHRLVMERMLGGPIPAGKFPDHEDMNGLNNRRSNLRLVSKAENAYNSKLSRRNTSGFKGVHASSGGWAVGIRSDYRNFYIGCFADKAEAAWMYDQWAIALHGDTARLNYDYELV